jgi:hypothetical protein
MQCLSRSVALYKKVLLRSVNNLQTGVDGYLDKEERVLPLLWANYATFLGIAEEGDVLNLIK